MTFRNLDSEVPDFSPGDQRSRQEATPMERRVGATRCHRLWCPA